MITLQKNMMDLKNNMAAYFETNTPLILSKLYLKFDNAVDITLIETRFFKGFINSRSNVYKNNFTRVSDYPDDLQEALDEEMLWAERYENINQEALMYIKSETEFQALDPSEYVEKDKIFYIQSGNDVLKFEIGQKIQITKNADVSSYMGNSNTTAFEDYVDEDEEISNEIIEVMPFVYLKPKRILVPMKNSLVDIETEFICAVSWGMFNANPKMLNQVSIFSDNSKSVLQENLSSLGKTTGIFVAGVSDKVGVIDMGDLKNLLDLFASYKIVIEQRALMNGVDKNAVYVQTEQISGEAKKVELIYINEVRKDKFPMYRSFEKKIAKKINELFGTDYVVETVIYEDIALSSEDMTANIQEQKTDANISDVEKDKDSDNSDNSDNNSDDKKIIPLKNTENNV